MDVQRFMRKRAAEASVLRATHAPRNATAAASIAVPRRARSVRNVRPRIAATAAAAGASATAAAAVEPEPDKEDHLCTICADAPTDRRFTACGHGACATCTDKVLADARKTNDAVDAVNSAAAAAAGSVRRLSNVPAVCPLCRVPLLEKAILVLPPDKVHPMFDEKAVDINAALLAAATTPVPQVAAAAWRAARVAEALPPGAPLAVALAAAAVDSLLVYDSALEIMRVATAYVVPGQVIEALGIARDAAGSIRNGGNSLTQLVSTARVCRMIGLISDCIGIHINNAAVVCAGVKALAATGIWAARLPQGALAQALTVHHADAEMASQICRVVSLFTRSRLSTTALARSIGAAVSTTVLAHAGNITVETHAIAALNGIVIHLTPAERAALAADGRLKPALNKAAARARDRGDESTTSAVFSIIGTLV